MTNEFWMVVAATVAQFIVGALWYSVLFGKQWGQVHGFDKLSKEVQAEMAKQMGPFYGLQFLLTVLTAWVLVQFEGAVSDYSVYQVALLVWIGFMVPTQVSAVVFGGTEPKNIVLKSSIMAGASLACLLVAAAVISAF